MPHGLQASGSSKKRNVLHGINSQGNINVSGLPGASGNMPISGQSGNNYKRIVNIYSMNNYKNKRKSHAPENRIHLNHSMLPPGIVGPYEEQRRHGGDNLQLPDITNSK